MGIFDGASNGMGAEENSVNFDQMIPRRPKLNSGKKVCFFDIIDKNFVL